jgi:hypothetical protein
MTALHEPGPHCHGDRRQPTLRLVLIDRWTQVAVERPWRYVAAWAIGIGAANLGLRMLLNDLSLARNAPLAILTAVGFLVFAWVYIAQLTRASRGQRSRLTVNAAIAEQSWATDWRAGSTGRRPATGQGARSQWRWSCPRSVKAPASRVVGRPPGQSTFRRRRLTLAAVAAAITLALLVAGMPSRSAASRGGHDVVVVPSWRN